MNFMLRMLLSPILRRRAAFVAGMVTLLTGSLPARADDTTLFEAVRAADMRVAAIGWRLATANVQLCDRIEVGTGLQLHTLDQFDAKAREAARTHFRFATAIAVEGVIPGSPADRAGVRPDDSLMRIGPIDVSELPGKAGSTDRLVAVQLAIAALRLDTPIVVELLRNGSRTQVTLQPIRACKSRFELQLDGGFSASADGTMVQIGSGFLDYPEDQLAAVIAHEFSHNILHHRDRLEARGVSYGLLAGFGSNVKYFRQTEVQADLLSIYLLGNAGYPMQATLAFWKHFGPSKAGGILRSRSHPAWRDRVTTLEAEIAKAETISARPMLPALIAERDKPLDGNWQSILVRR